MVTRLKQPHVSTSSTETSSESKNSLNGDNGRKDTTERRLAKPKTNSGTSLISQRSIQPSLTAPPIRPNGLRRDMSNDTLANTSANDEDEEQDTPPQSFTNDVSREVSASNSKDVWASVPRPTVRAHYKLHNPLGPRWYRNHHLIPPSHFKPSMRPPTFFSSSFPPIGTASHDYPDDDEDHSRSPSHSPLPTPESSQTRVQDGSKPRSRKTSQTAPDAIDMLDLSDPWGQNWHHQSPYEFGQTTTVASFDTTDLPNRTRRASFSVANARQRSVAPSPLSQSTSAVNLPSLQPEIKPPRKLSKRKTTNVTTIFQDPPPQADRKAFSVPATPIDAPVLPSAPLASDMLPNRMSTSPAGPFMSTPSPTTKREKRGSLLNRLVKKFSTLKRGSEPILGGIEGWNYEASSIDIHRRETTSAAGNTYAFPEKPDASGDRPEDDRPVHPRVEDDRASLSSLEIPYSVMGKLTVINPDPYEEENEPIAAENLPQSHPPELNNEPSSSLPHLDKDIPASPDRPDPVGDDRSAPPSDDEPETDFDKPLPPRLGTPRFSRLVMSEITISTPQVLEQPLPPLPPKEEHVPKAMRSPSPGHPPEHPESPRLSTFDPFHIVNSISLDHTTHTPPPVQAQIAPEGLKKAPTQRKSASPPAVPSKHVAERKQTQSPPAATTVQRDLGRQPSAAPSPEVTPTTERKAGSLRSVNGQVSLSSRELPAEFKSLPSRTRSRSNSRPETRNVPAAVQIPPQILVPFPALIEESRPFHADSPVSTSSMLANPPTPFDHRISINVSDKSSTPPAVPPKSVRHQSPPPPRTTGTIKRQTETFRLVRSSSGNVYASSQTILAQGQQWEVVESVETTKKDRTMKMKADEKKFKDQGGRERESDRERERDKEREVERERQRARERDLEREKQRAREEKKREAERSEERAKERERREEQRELEKERAKERERREEERVREIQRAKEKKEQREWERREAERQREKEKERERQREKERERAQRDRDRERRKERERRDRREREKEREREERERRERQRTRDYKRRSRDYTGDAGSKRHSHSRNRPLSQLPSADEIDRLSKARSLGTVDHLIPGHSSTSSMSDDIPEIIPEVHGSSHTAYLVQTPSRPQIYRSMPTAPPPIYFHSPASIPSIPDSLSSYEPYETLRFYPGPAQVPEPLPLPSFPPKSNNPLPEPPRESPYKPSLLPSISPSNRRSTEYWTYNGITTAH